MNIKSILNNALVGKRIAKNNQLGLKDYIGWTITKVTPTPSNGWYNSETDSIESEFTIALSNNYDPSTIKRFVVLTNQEIEVEP